MTDCNNYIEMISAMIDGELPQEQEAELRAHIEQCPDCRRVFDAFKGISCALSGELAAPPDTLAKGVMYKINVQKKAHRRFAFGRFTALAACLVLVLLGAAHFGLINGLKMGSSESLAAPKAAESQNVEVSIAPESSDAAEAGGSSDTTAKDSRGDSEESMLVAGAPDTECEDGAVLQFGFTTQNVLTANAGINADIKEPEFLFNAKEIIVYEGKYYLEEENTDKNKYLFTLTTEEELSALYELVTAMPDNSVEYTSEDGEILKSDPLYTLYVPVDTAENEGAKDKIICVWFVNGQVWCVISDAEIPDPARNVSAEKILYKAEGVQEKFEKAIEEIKSAKGIK